MNRPLQASLFDWMPLPEKEVAQPVQKPAPTPAPAPSGRWLFKAGDLITDRTRPDSPFKVLEQLEVHGQKMYRVLWIPGQRETALRVEVATRWHRGLPAESAPAVATAQPEPEAQQAPAFPLRSRVSCRGRDALVIFSGPVLTLVEFQGGRILWVPHAELALLAPPAVHWTRASRIRDILHMDATCRDPWWARPEAQEARKAWLSDLTPEQLLKEHQLYQRIYKGAPS